MITAKATIASVAGGDPRPRVADPAVDGGEDEREDAAHGDAVDDRAGEQAERRLQCRG